MQSNKMPPENDNKLHIDRRKRLNNKRIIGCCIATNQCFLQSSRCYFIEEIPKGYASII
jgi:hypothetical protein